MTSNSDSITPMMRQYRQIKAGLPADAILFFRLGDFYEMFFEDAVEVSRILDITLTKRQGVPMCGVPHHAADLYLARLIRAGKKVAICDQVEDPATAKGIVRREVTGIVTPGAVVADQVLDANRNNYLAGIYVCRDVFGLAALDLSTGEFCVEKSASRAGVEESLARLAPAECVAPAELTEPAGALAWLRQARPGMVLTPHDDWAFEQVTAGDTLTRHFGVQSLDGFGCVDCPALVGAAGGVLHYVKNTLRRNVTHVRRLTIRSQEDFLLMDEASRINLELVAARTVARPGFAGALAAGAPAARAQSARVHAARPPASCLLEVLDSTCTAMGGRLLREWLIRPLIRPDAIRRRQDVLEYFTGQRTLLHDVRAVLEQVRDLERIVARLESGGGNARDARALGQSLAMLPELRRLLDPAAAPVVRELVAGIEPLPELVALIDRALVDEPPAGLKDGGMIRPGYHAPLDELRAAAASGRNWLAEYQVTEQQRTGIKTLKVRHNRVFGYYIEVSKGQSDNVPENYSRKQTLVNAERFITPELREYEAKIIGAHDRAILLEQELFAEIRAAALKETAAIQRAASALAALDALAALAERALALRYTRPVITESDAIVIRDGRHPVVEQVLEGERFVPNDVLLDGRANRLHIITGPNMAGKSTYIRQVALIVIMAQMGSFVPASAAEIGVVDRVFTRVGAGDDLTRGRSTFMVEMQETANILNNAGARSLVILDEIGRGTSTFDGISIAWAVAEYLHDKIGARALFATHYHELTDLERTLAGVKNYNVLAREQGDHVVFLRKIVPGGADKSYGIQVGRLAGLPPEVVERAGEILLNLEEGELGEAGQPKLAVRRTRKIRTDQFQLTLFE